MYWLIDHVDIWQFLLGIVALGYGVAFYLTKRVRYLAIAGGLVAAIILLWFAPNWIVTDRKRIELNVREMADAVAAQKFEKLRAHLADDFEYGGAGADEVARLAVQAAKAHKVGTIEIRGCKIENFDSGAGTAEAYFIANVDANTYICNCRGYFRRVGDRWKMYKLEAFKPFVDQNAPIQIPIR